MLNQWRILTKSWNKSELGSTHWRLDSIDAWSWKFHLQLCYLCIAESDCRTFTPILWMRLLELEKFGLWNTHFSDWKRWKVVSGNVIRTPPSGSLNIEAYLSVFFIMKLKLGNGKGNWHGRLRNAKPLFCLFWRLNG